MFSLLMPPWVETNSERPLKVVSLMVTKKERKKKVRVRKKTELVVHRYSGTVGSEL